MTASRAKTLTTTPLFVVSNLQNSIDLYGRMLGFEEPSVWGDPPCFCMISRHSFDLMLSLAEDPPAVRPNGPGGVWDMYVRIDDVEREVAALREAGCAIARAPERTFYDMLEFEVIDPDGYRICFAQDVA